MRYSLHSQHAYTHIPYVIGLPFGDSHIGPIGLSAEVRGPGSDLTPYIGQDRTEQITKYKQLEIFISKISKPSFIK